MGRCQEEILRVPLEKLAKALTSGKHSRLDRFLNRDSDGLGHPLPQDVCRHFGFAVVYTEDVIPDYNADVLARQKEARRARRTDRQRVRRAASRLGTSTGDVRLEKAHLAPHRNSTIHLATGALVTLHWTGGWHYREQAELLEIMGLAKSQDFVRDRVEYLRTRNRAMCEMLESRAIAIKNCA
jgi:hypothetical protein